MGEGGIVTRGRKLSPERRSLLDELIRDQWPIRQMYQTYGFGTATVKKHYPDYCGMSLSDAGKLGMSMRHTEVRVQQYYLPQQRKAA